MERRQHQGGGPPAAIEHPTPQQAGPQRPQQQRQNERHQEQCHGHAMAQGQIDRQVVGMAMPVAGAQGIDQAEGRSAPAQPGTLGDQTKGNLPLGQPGDLKD